jgi:hypothetical protein
MKKFAPLLALLVSTTAIYAQDITPPDMAQTPVETEGTITPPGEGVESVPVAETPHSLYEEIGTSGDWTAIRFTPEAGRMVCAIFSRPIDSRILEDGEAIPALRGERAAFITWENGPVVDEEGVFSVMVGAPLSDAFDDHKFSTELGEFPMFGYEDRLFVEEGSDTAAIEIIRKGLSLNLSASLPGDRTAEDEYSLKGVVGATNMASGVCGS